jgi:hypothetical protein
MNHQTTVIQYGIEVDEIFDVRIFENGIGNKKRAYVSPISGIKLLMQVDIPNELYIEPLRGRIRILGRRQDKNRELYEEVAKRCDPIITDPSNWKFDIMYLDGLSYKSIPEDITTQTTFRVATTPIQSNLAPPQFNPFPITITINAGSLWESRKTGRVVRIISAMMTTSSSVFDALLTVEVVSNSKRKSSAKKMRLSSLFSGYLPKV